MGSKANGTVPEVGPSTPPSAPLRHSTVSMAVGASCVDNAQNQMLATLLASQIARAAAIFNVDEVVVLDDVARPNKDVPSPAASMLAKILQYLETPQYLRKALIPMHPELKFAGLMPPLDATHHLRASEWDTYREGVVRHSSPDAGSLVDVGLENDALIPEQVAPGSRVTLEVGPAAQLTDVHGQQVYLAKLAAPTEPRAVQGRPWGYLVRYAPTLQSMLQDSPFDGSYDLCVGTSERGEQTPAHELQFRPYRHALVVFGGPQGLEQCLLSDPWSAKYKDVSQLFDRYVNTCFHQGSRTIRTEEAIFISMSFLDTGLQKSCMS